MRADTALLTAMTARTVAAYVGNHAVAAADLPTLVVTVYAALAKPAGAPPAVQPTPAVPIRRSVTPTTVACLECGRTTKILKRHLRQEHGLSPWQYRAKWSLPETYPMTAPAYSEERSALAKAVGLGRSRKGRTRKASAPSAA